MNHPRVEFHPTQISPATLFRASYIQQKRVTLFYLDPKSFAFRVPADNGDRHGLNMCTWKNNPPPGREKSTESSTFAFADDGCHKKQATGRDSTDRRENTRRSIVLPSPYLHNVPCTAFASSPFDFPCTTFAIRKPSLRVHAQRRSAGFDANFSFPVAPLFIWNSNPTPLRFISWTGWLVNDPPSSLLTRNRDTRNFLSGERSSKGNSALYTVC